MSRHTLANQSLSDICANLQELQAQRRAVLRMQIRISNGCLAFVRRMLGCRTDMPEKERNRIAKEAKGIVAAIQVDGAAQVASADDQSGHDSHWGSVIHAATPFCLQAKQSEEPWKRYRNRLEKQMKQLAEQLPVWQWAKDIHGFGSLGLAIIVGESGNLSNYATHQRLWKRLGLAVIAGEAQRKCKDKELAEMHGYNPQRRSAIFTIGEALMKLNTDGYKQCYETRKAYERNRDSAMTKLHSHRRAKRFMEKQLIRDLWQQWNKCGQVSDD